MRKDVLQETTSAILGPVEKHLKYPKTTLAAGLAVAATAGLVLAAGEMPRDTSSTNNSGSSTGTLEAPGKHESSKLVAGDVWACDPEYRYDSVLRREVYLDKPYDIQRLRERNPAAWALVGMVIAPDIQTDPFPEEFSVHAEVKYADEQDAAEALKQAVEYAETASEYFDMPQGNPADPANRAAIAEQSDVDGVFIVASRPGICPA